MDGTAWGPKAARIGALMWSTCSHLVAVPRSGLAQIGSVGVVPVDAVVPLLHHEDQAAKQHDHQAHREAQRDQHAHAALNRVHQHVTVLGRAGHFRHGEDARETEDPENGQVGAAKPKFDVIRDDRDEVDEVGHLQEVAPRLQREGCRWGGTVGTEGVRARSPRGTIGSQPVPSLPTTQKKQRLRTNGKHGEGLG